MKRATWMSLAGGAAAALASLVLAADELQGAAPGLSLTAVFGVVAALVAGLLRHRYRLFKDRSHEEAAKFEALVEQLPLATYIQTLDASGATLYVSDQIEELTGFSSRTVIDEPGLWEQRIPDSHRWDVRQGLLHHKRAGTPLSLEYPFIRRDGTTLWFAQRARVVRSAAGRPLYSEGVLFDVTAIKQREAPLLRRLKMLGAVFDSAPVGVVTMVSGGKIVSANAAIEVMLGYRAEELASLSVRDLIAPEDASELVRRFDDTLAGLIRPQQTQVRLVRKGGGRLVANLTVLRLPEDEAEDQSLSSIIVEDVTERVEREQEIERSVGLLQATLDSIADGILVVDEGGRAIEFNQRFLDMWDMPTEVAGSPAQIRREHIFQQFRDPAGARQRAQELLGDPSSEGRALQELKDGRWIEVSVGRTWSGGDVSGRVVTFRDVTQQRRATALLEDQARILKDIARDAPLEDVLNDLCLTVGRYNFGSLCSVLLVDDEHDALVAKAAPALMGFYDLFGPMAVDPGNGPCGKAASSGELVVVEDIVRDPLFDTYRDRVLPYGMRSCCSFPIKSSSGAVLGTFALYRRETGRPNPDDLATMELWTNLAAVAIERERAARQRHRLEDRVYQAEKMEGVARLAGGFAHDLGNILTAVGLNSELLRPEVRSPMAVEALNDLQKAALMAGHLVDDLLNLMRPAYRQLTDINAVVRDMRSLLGGIVKHNVAVEIEQEDVPACAEIDISQFQQVLLNLVMNADEAMPDGGLIRITSEPDGAENLVLTVADDGIGMDPQTQEQAFEPFFTTKRSGGAKGVGLGLASARAAMNRVGGDITIESHPGTGTVVRVHLPLAAEQIERPDDLVTKAVTSR